MRLLGLIFLLALPGAALAQTGAETLADIKAEISAVSAEIAGLRQELVVSGAAADASAGGSPLQRMDAIEAELVRLTGLTEGLENRINQVVADSDLRLKDLEFRLSELEGGDPLATEPAPPPPADLPVAGDAATPSPTPDPAEPAAPAADLAINEQSDFDRAQAALDSGSFRSAADLFGTFAQSYPGGSLTARAQLLQGDALASDGDYSNAARAYLESFSGSPSGDVAPDALYKLGVSLSQLGQVNEACITLGEVGARFPDAPAAGDAERERQALQCQ